MTNSIAKFVVRLTCALAFSMALTAQAEPKAPNPTSLVVTGSTSSSLSLGWSSGGGSTSGFKVAYLPGATAPTIKCASGTILNVGTATTKTVTSLNPGVTYTFRVCAYNSTGSIGNNGVTTSGTTLSAPLATFSSGSSYNFGSLETLGAAGTVYTDLLFSNTGSTAIDFSTGPRFSLTASPASVGVYGVVSDTCPAFLNPGSSCSVRVSAYSNVDGNADANSNVITLSVLHQGAADVGSTRLLAVYFTGTPTCPTNFVAISANADVNVSANFCVAKYEMKILGNDVGTTTYNSAMVADSRSTGTPWTMLSQTQARDECAALGAGYSLISNPEWQAIAREIETAGTSTTNWSNMGGGGKNVSISQDFINTGISDNVATWPRDAGDGSNPCLNTGKASCTTVTSTTDFKYKRTHTLKSGDIIWDIAGNADEFTTGVQNTVADAAIITSGNVCLRTSWLTDGSHDGTAALWGPYGAVNATYAYTGANKCVAASYYGGLGSSSLSSTTSNGFVFTRGGFFGNSAYVTGIYSGKPVHGTSPQFYQGFRCVYHP